MPPKTSAPAATTTAPVATARAAPQPATTAAPTAGAPSATSAGAAALAALSARVAASEARDAENAATNAQLVAALAEIRADHKRKSDELEGHLGELMAENADKAAMIADLQNAQGIAEESAAMNLIPGDLDFMGKRLALARDLFPKLRVGFAALNKNVPDVERAKKQIIKAYMLVNNTLVAAELAREAKGGRPFAFA